MTNKRVIILRTRCPTTFRHVWRVALADSGVLYEYNKLSSTDQYYNLGAYFTKYWGASTTYDSQKLADAKAEELLESLYRNRPLCDMPIPAVEYLSTSYVFYGD